MDIKHVSSSDSIKTALTNLRNFTTRYFNVDDSTSKQLITKTALQCYKDEVFNSCILSYNENLDFILKDLIVPKTITELAGESGSGKTQICFQLCITVQLPKQFGGLEGEALYINTNNNFASHRIRDLSKTFLNRYESLTTKMTHERSKFNEEFILQHIHYIRTRNYLELMACMEILESYLKGKRVRLIVIDSISYPIRFLDADTRNIVAARLFQRLRNLATTYNFSVVLTNDLTTRVTKGESYVTPSFGDSFYHLVNTRVRLSKRNAAFRASVVKSVLSGEKETLFVI